MPQRTIEQRDRFDGLDITWIFDAVPANKKQAKGKGDIIARMSGDVQEVEKN